MQLTFPCYISNRGDESFDEEDEESQSDYDDKEDEESQSDYDDEEDEYTSDYEDEDEYTSASEDNTDDIRNSRY